MQGVCVHAAAQDFAATRRNGVVGARKAGDAVEQNDDVLAVFDGAFCLFDDELGDADMVECGLIESRAKYLAAHAALHVGDLLGALID